MGVNDEPDADAAEETLKRATGSCGGDSVQLRGRPMRCPSSSGRAAPLDTAASASSRRRSRTARPTTSRRSSSAWSEAERNRGRYLQSIERFSSPNVTCLVIFLSSSFAWLCSARLRRAARSETPSPSRTAVAPAGSVEATSKSARPARHARIVFLGDSLTAGLGLPEGGELPISLIQARLDNDGFAYEVRERRRLRRHLGGRRGVWTGRLDGNVKVLLVALGGNDGLAWPALMSCAAICPRSSIAPSSAASR